MLRFRLLGTIDLQGDDGDPCDQLLRQPKRLALLAYLALPTPGTWHRRDALLAQFWPELDTAHARTALRNALYVLRQCLGDSTIRARGDEEVSVDPNALTTDVAAVWEALQGGRTGEALADYRGELLSGLYVADSDGFERWLDTERARLRTAVARAGADWTATMEARGDLMEARSVAARLVEIQPDDEPAVRRLIELHGAAGDRSGALAAYETYRDRLLREFGAVPSPETVALATRLRGTDGALPAGTSPTSVPPQAVAKPAAHLGAAPDATPQRPDRRTLSRVLIILSATILVAATALLLTKRPHPPEIGKSYPVTAGNELQIEPAISPNGRLVAYASGTPLRMRIFITRIGGGTPWALSDDSSSIEILPRWSPDGDALVFLSRNSAYVAPAVGGAARLIAEGGDNQDAVRSAAWSPEGDSIVIVRHDSVLVRPLEGPGARLVGTGSQLHSCVWSPNRRWIACVSGNWIAFVPGTIFGNQAQSGIVVFPGRGGASVTFTDRNHAHLSPAWSPDSRYLWFVSDQDGRWGEVYAAEVGESGRPTGPLRRVGLQAESISLTRSRVAYSAYTRRANLWMMPIPKGGAVGIDAAQPVTSGDQIIEVFRGSTDGKWLVYDSNLRGNSDIYRIPAGGGLSERLTDDPRDEYAPALSPDNREVAYHLWNDGKRRLYVRNLESGSAGEALPEPGDQGVPTWSPDGQRMMIWDHATEPGQVFQVRRRTNGSWYRSWREPQAQLPFWAPDGRSVGILLPSGKIDLIPADGGARRVLYAPRQGSNDPIPTNVAWIQGRPDLWFLGHDPSGRRGIWALPMADGRPRLLVDLADRLGRTNGPTLATDGDRFYFTLDERLSSVRWAEVVRK